jgi:hypothetical protein
MWSSKVGTIPSEILAAGERQRAILNLRSTGVEVKEPDFVPETK